MRRRRLPEPAEERENLRHSRFRMNAGSAFMHIATLGEVLARTICRTLPYAGPTKTFGIRQKM